MSRNFFSRVETCFPVEDKRIRERVFQEVFSTYLNDNAQAWELQSDGSYVRKESKRNRKAAQEQLLAKLAE